MNEELDHIEDDEEEMFWEPYSPHENIGAAYNSINALEGMDDALMRPIDKKRVKQIRRMALLIIHHSLSEIYEVIFENKENDDDAV